MMMRGPYNDTTTANGLWREDEGLLRARRRKCACAEGVRSANEQSEELSRSESRKSPRRQVRGAE